jgi:prophage maintenance system killer protein
MEYLTVHDIETINNTIHNMSHYNPKIEHVAAFNTRTDKLHILTRGVSKYTTMLDTATYYMKNLILLQCFSDGNHRTALEAVRLFFHKNNIDFKWNPKNVVKMQRDIYKLRYQVYTTYEELPVSVLTEPYNSLWIYCRNCIEDVLSQ